MKVEITTMTFWSSLFEILVINLILSGDNAVVIALATLHLEEKERRKGIFWGTFIAVALRIGLTAIAVILLRLPYIQALGGLLLLFIAVKLLKGEEDSAQGADNRLYSLQDAIRTIIVADLLMSLDNVLAVAGAAGGNIQLLILGLAISIPIVIFGSSFLSRLMHKYPWLISAGAGLLGFTAGKMILSDASLGFLADQLLMTKGLPIILAVGVALFGNGLNYGKTQHFHNSIPKGSVKEQNMKNDLLQESFVQVFAEKKQKL